VDSIWRKPVSTHASSICCAAGFGEFGEFGKAQDVIDADSLSVFKRDWIVCEVSRWASSWTSRSAKPYGLICSPEQVRRLRRHLVSHLQNSVWTQSRRRVLATYFGYYVTVCHCGRMRMTGSSGCFVFAVGYGDECY